MLRDGGANGFVPYPQPTEAERARWRERRGSDSAWTSSPEVVAAAIRARENWYAGGFDRTIAEQRARIPAWALDEGLLDLPENSDEPADLKPTTPNLMDAMNTPPKRKAKAARTKPTPVLAKVISDLEAEIARLTEARERLTAIEGNPNGRA